MIVQLLWLRHHSSVHLLLGLNCGLICWLHVRHVRGLVRLHRRRNTWCTVERLGDWITDGLRWRNTLVDDLRLGGEHGHWRGVVPSRSRGDWWCVAG